LRPYPRIGNGHYDRAGVNSSYTASCCRAASQAQKEKDAPERVQVLKQSLC